jgi:hypothetical protein
MWRKKCLEPRLQRRQPLVEAFVVMFFFLLCQSYYVEIEPVAQALQSLLEALAPSQEVFFFLFGYRLDFFEDKIKWG